MKNFDDFSKRIQLNESELSFLNESDSELLNLGDSIALHLEDNGIHAEHEMKNGELHISVGGEDFVITKSGSNYSLKSFNDNENFADEHDLISWWASFVPQYKQGKAEYNNNESKFDGDPEMLKIEKHVRSKYKFFLVKEGERDGSGFQKGNNIEIVKGYHEKEDADSDFERYKTWPPKYGIYTKEWMVRNNHDVTDDANWVQAETNSQRYQKMKDLEE